MYHLFEKKWGELGFSLASGVAYFIIVWNFISRYTYRGGNLLAFFFAPAIICGMALILIKTIRAWREQELWSRLNTLILVHIVIALAAVVFLLDAILKF